MNKLLYAAAIVLLSFFTCKGEKGVKEADDFPTRKGATEGRLANGIKYYTFSTPWVKGKFAIGMVVNSGSLYETKDEIGIAHFLEHLCSTSVPGYDRAKTLEIVHQGGLDLFNDWQAATSDTRTVYNFIYPKEDKKTERDFIRYTRGVLADMEFTKEKVDAERKVILKETQSSFGVNSYANLKGGYYDKHSLLGDSTQLCAITAEKINKFYRKWYRPENIALVMLGDAPAEELQAKLVAAFDDARCVVDSLLPTSHLPLNESNIYLYGKQKSIDQGYDATIIYRFPQIPLSSKSELRKAIAAEMVTQMLKGILEGPKNGGNGFKVSSVMQSNMPRASVTNISFTCRDTVEYLERLNLIGNAISVLRYGAIDTTFLRQLWKKSRSTYSFFPVEEKADLNRVLRNIYGDFAARRPLTEPRIFIKALNEAASQITEDDIHHAAEQIFTSSHSMLANFPDYGKDFEQKMEAFLSTSCTNRVATASLNIPGTLQVDRGIAKDRKLLPMARPSYSESMIAKEEALPNGMIRYTLGNGLEIVWDKTSQRQHVSVITSAGVGNIDEKDRPFMQRLKSIRSASVLGINPKTFSQTLRKWKDISTSIDLSYRQVQLNSEWNKRNVEFLWQYISQVYSKMSIDESSYLDAVKSFSKLDSTVKGADNYNGLMTGAASNHQPLTPARLNLEMANKHLNRLLVPGQTRVYLQGNADIGMAIAYLSAIPTKEKVDAPREKLWTPKEDVKKQNLTRNAKTFLVSRLYNEPLKSLTVKQCLMHGMLEEYMSRRILIVIRNEKGLIYTWGTTPIFGNSPQPFTALGLRFRIIPELLEESLVAFDELCKQVSKDGVTDKDVSGLKQREWNRYLDISNNPETAMNAIETQLSCTGHVWSNEEVREVLGSITTEEVSKYIKRYMSRSSFTNIY